MPKIAVADMTREDYERAAQEYLANLPLEHFMEAEPQGTQRSITISSFQWLEARRPGFHFYNELLVQYPFEGELGQVVPDNMVVLGGAGHEDRGSYNLVYEHIPLFWTLEYVSSSSKRKDYHESFLKYEQQLRVPYYLVFHPEKQDLRLYHLEGEKYVQVEVDAQGRLSIPELEISVDLHRRWVRYWYQGKLIPLPAELQQEVELQDQRIDYLEEITETLSQEREAAELRAAQDRERREAAERRAAQDRQEREAAECRAQAERQEREAADRRAQAERQEREAADRRAQVERQEREAAERRAQVERQEREAQTRRAEHFAAQLRALGIDPAA